MRAALEDNGGGLVCASQLAHIEDELIHAIHHYVVTYVHPATERRPPPNPCVVAAVGGYGRATLAPGSDIDLLFLLPDAAPRRSQSVVQSILYALWDLGQKVGHSTRTVEECLDEARGDMTVRTALLEARFLLGDAALFETMRTRFEREIVHGTAAEFVAAKLAERDARVAKAGRSRYLVEPNVKDGKGGLRDLNTLFWIAKYVYEVREAARTRRRRPVLARRIQAVLPLRGVSLAGALPSPFHDRPARGEADLRPSAPDRRASSAIRPAAASPASSAS